MVGRKFLYRNLGFYRAKYLEVKYSFADIVSLFDIKYLAISRTNLCVRLVIIEDKKAIFYCNSDFADFDYIIESLPKIIKIRIYNYPYTYVLYKKHPTLPNFIDYQHGRRLIDKVQEIIDKSTNIELPFTTPLDIILANIDKIQAINLNKYNFHEICKINNIQDMKIRFKGVLEDIIYILKALPGNCMKLCITLKHPDNSWTNLLEYLEKFTDLKELSLYYSGELRVPPQDLHLKHWHGFINLVTFKTNFSLDVNEIVSSSCIKNLVLYDKEFVDKETLKQNYCLIKTTNLNVIDDNNGEFLESILTRNAQKYRFAKTKAILPTI